MTRLTGTGGKRPFNKRCATSRNGSRTAATTTVENAHRLGIQAIDDTTRAAVDGPDICSMLGSSRRGVDIRVGETDMTTTTAAAGENAASGVRGDPPKPPLPVRPERVR